MFAEKLLFNVLIFQIVVFAVGCGRERTRDVSSDIVEIRELSAARAKAFNEGDAGTIANAFTEDGLLMAPGAPSASGRLAVRNYYQGIFDEYETELESGYEDVKVSGDLAYGIGYARVKLIPRTGGDTLVSTAKYVNILQRQADGSWLTTHDIWNGNE